MLVLGLGDGLKNKEIMDFFEFWAFKKMKSGFYCTNLKQINSRKLLKVVFKYIFTIDDQKIALIIPRNSPMVLL